MADKNDQALEKIDASRRDTVRKLVLATAFTAPVISTFAIDGKMNAAFAGNPNTTSS